MSTLSGASKTTSQLGSLPSPVHNLLDSTDHLYASPAWLRAEQAVASEPPFFTWAHDADGGTAFAAAYRFDQTSNPWPYARLDLFLQQQGFPIADGTGVLPSYLLGGRRPGHSRLLHGGPDTHRSTMLTELIGTAAKEATSRGASTLAALYCDQDDHALAAAFAEHGALRLPSHPAFVLDLPGATWGDWLGSLPRKRRSNETADARKLQAGGVRITVAPMRADNIDWIVPMELDLYSRHGSNYLQEEARSLHQAYLDHLGDDVLLVQAERKGAPIGFASLVRHGDTAYLRQAGFDQDACAGAPVYFGTVYHAAIQWAYAHGVSTLDFSVSAGDVKLRRGCRQLDRSAWILPLNQTAESILRPLAEPAGTQV
ncbi:GNAT family N-acetyltransferase [Streptomyces sp. NPDC004647]|uniref:GNAT family N-acetyltransferase n=1 Tax=Streptomyces sp. NPDC004647 TaxID=3154671 RepID=UPI0033A068A8